MLNLAHKKLEVWKLSLNLIKELYVITDNFPKSEIYGLINQIRRAAVSISANLAEGCSRKSAQERYRFFEIARSSLVEIDTHLEIAKEINFLKEKDELNLNQKINKLFAKLTVFLDKSK
jgi:four helix bundle protein